MIVLDTNVVSELMRGAAEASVRRRFSAMPIARTYTTTITQAEVLFGIARMASGKRRDLLEREAQAVFAEDFRGRVLPFDAAAATAYASVAARRRTIGRPVAPFDAAIAAIALANGMAIATRNVRDFADCGVAVMNPWED